MFEGAKGHEFAKWSSTQVAGYDAISSDYVRLPFTSSIRCRSATLDRKHLAKEVSSLQRDFALFSSSIHCGCALSRCLATPAWSTREVTNRRCTWTLELMEVPASKTSNPSQRQGKWKSLYARLMGKYSTLPTSFSNQH